MTSTTMSVTEAKSHFSALVDMAAAGTPVTISRFNKPLVTIVPAPEHASRRFGIYAGLVPDDAALLAPMSEDELAAWE